MSFMIYLKGIRRLLSHCKRIMIGTPIFPNIHPSAFIADDAKVTSPCDLYMEEDTSIPRGATIMNGPNGRFFMKRWSFTSIDLLVICGNHMPVIGMPLIKVTDELKRQMDTKHRYSKDVVVEEDVWIGARVTLLPGAYIGRGSIIAAGAVVNTTIPPYSIWGGVPSKFIKFKWTIEEVLEHESKVYRESERLTREELERTRSLYV